MVTWHLHGEKKPELKHPSPHQGTIFSFFFFFKSVEIQLVKSKAEATLVFLLFLSRLIGVLCHH